MSWERQNWERQNWEKEKSSSILLRRRFLQLAGISGFSLMMEGCSSSLLSPEVNRIFEPINQKVETLIFNPAKLAPEFPKSAIEPEALLINTYKDTPEIDRAAFRLEITGQVNQPLSLSLAEIEKLPRTSMVIRHVCVEGWSAIVQWAGVRLGDLIQMAKPKTDAQYVYFMSADGYYESWDLASSIHPQTLMVFEKNGAPLSIDNGAPLRLASPIKLGYKLSKWVTQIILTDKLMDSKGYWEDQGYEWYAGL
jgi:DMSO/TMAO reductase YedYZ molybdopterin-dependent catalytic subunit